MPTRRELMVLGLCGVSQAAVSVHAAPAWAFAEQGAFRARILSLGEDSGSAEMERAAARWTWELVRRTSAPGKLSTELVEPASPHLLEEPFVIWAGTSDPRALRPREVRRMREYLRMGGLLVVDDREPTAGVFGRGARRELARVLPESVPVKLDPKHVLFKSFYLLAGPTGRHDGPPTLEAIIRGKTAQVLFLQHDLLGALARTERGDGWAHPVEPGGAMQRELAVRTAVNIAMYALCSDYKDDQVHAPFLMRRRKKQR